MPVDYTSEFLRNMIITGAKFDFNGKALYFNVFCNDKTEVIVQLLQPDAPITITSLVLISICLNPYQIYKSWNIEAVFGTEFDKVMTDAIVSYLSQNVAKS